MGARAIGSGSRASRLAQHHHRLLLAATLVLSALSVGLAMRSAQHAWLVWVRIVPLLIAVRFLPPSKAAAVGMTWGLSLLLSSLALQGAEDQIPLTVLTVSLMTVVPAAYGWLGAALTNRLGFNPLLLALGWIGVEFALRPIGLPGGLLLATQQDSAVSQLVASALGYGFVGFIIVFVNAILVGVAGFTWCRRPSVGLPPVWRRDDDFVRLAPCWDTLLFVSHDLHLSAARGPPQGKSRAA